MAKRQPKTQSHPHRVAILNYPNVSMFELGCATELFAIPRPEFSRWYDTQVIQLNNQSITTTAGIKIESTPVQDLKNFDTLVIPGWNVNTPELDIKLSQLVINFYNNGGRLLSFCSGAFFIAETGLLDHRKATTHWRYSELFKQKYANVNFVENVLYIYEDKIGCSAGSAAAIDLGLEVIRQDFGHDIANQVARRLVMSPHRNGGQSQFVETPMITATSKFSATLDWAIKHLNQAIDINDLARLSAMSRRSFDRHFRASLGLSPKEWLNKQRLQLAQKYLENSNDTIDVIAGKSGFNNAMNMRHYFRLYLGISPRHYREQFSAR